MTKTNQRFVQDLNRLITARQVNTKVLPEITYDPIASMRGIGNIVKLPEASGGGVASPLKEIAGRREYHPPKLLKSSDGLFVIEQQALKSAAFLDLNSNEVILEFEDDD